MWLFFFCKAVLIGVSCSFAIWRVSESDLSYSGQLSLLALSSLSLFLSAYKQLKTLIPFYQPSFLHCFYLYSIYLYSIWLHALAPPHFRTTSSLLLILSFFSVPLFSTPASLSLSRSLLAIHAQACSSIYECLCGGVRGWLMRFPDLRTQLSFPTVLSHTPPMMSLPLTFNN